MRRGIEKADTKRSQAGRGKLKALRRQGLVGKQLITRREYHADAAQQAAFVVDSLELALSDSAAHPFEFDLPPLGTAPAGRASARRLARRVPACSGKSSDTIFQQLAIQSLRNRVRFSSDSNVIEEESVTSSSLHQNAASFAGLAASQDCEEVLPMGTEFVNE